MDRVRGRALALASAALWLLRPRRSRLAPPPHLTCTITGELFEDPVVLVCTGHTYERSALLSWFTRRGAHGAALTCPLTNLEVEYANVVPNWALRAAVELWRQEHGLEALPPPKHALVHPRLLCKSQSWSSALLLFPQLTQTTRTGAAVLLFVFLGRLLAEQLRALRDGESVVLLGFIACAVLMGGGASPPAWMNAGRRRVAVR